LETVSSRIILRLVLGKFATQLRFPGFLLLRLTRSPTSANSAALSVPRTRERHDAAADVVPGALVETDVDDFLHDEPDVTVSTTTKRMSADGKQQPPHMFDESYARFSLHQDGARSVYRLFVAHHVPHAVASKEEELVLGGALVDPVK
jgi:hypothetical protein